MQELGIDQTRLIEASGVSDFTVRDLMKGVSRNYRDRSLWAVSKALGWSHDSIHCILGGHPPVVVADEVVRADPDPYEAIRDQLAGLSEAVAQLAEQSARNGETAFLNGQRLERLSTEVERIGTKQNSGWDRMSQLEQLAASTMASQRLNRVVEASEAPELIRELIRRQSQRASKTSKTSKATGASSRRTG